MCYPSWFTVVCPELRAVPAAVGMKACTLLRESDPREAHLGLESERGIRVCTALTGVCSPALTTGKFTTACYYGFREDLMPLVSKATCTRWHTP